MPLASLIAYFAPKYDILTEIIPLEYFLSSVRHVKRREYRHGNTGELRKRLLRREYAADFVCVFPQGESDEYLPRIPLVL